MYWSQETYFLSAIIKSEKQWTAATKNTTKSSLEPPYLEAEVN